MAKPTAAAPLNTPSHAGLHNFHANVMMYGAAANGVTDDSNAFDLAATDVTAAGGGTIYVPAGNYNITSTVNVPTGCSLEGAGYGSRIMCNTYQENIVTADTASNVRISGLRLTHTNPGLSGGDGIRFQDVTDSHISDVWISGADMGIRSEIGVTGTKRITITRAIISGSLESGILLAAATDCILTDCISSDNGSSTLHHGIYISHTASTRTQINNCNCFDNPGGGIQIQGTYHVINGGIMQGNHWGVVPYGCSDLTITGTAALGCLGGDGFFVEACNRTNLVGVRADGGTLNGINFKNTSYCSIVGGIVSNNTRHGVWLNCSVVGDVVRDCTVSGVVAVDNDSGDTSTYSGISLDSTGGTCLRNTIVGCTSKSTGAVTKQIYGVHVNGANNTKNAIVGNALFQNKTAAIQDDGAYTIIMGNQTLSSTYPVIQLDETNGKLNFGSGSIALDTNLYRSAANVLKTDDSFAVAGTYVGLPTGSDLRNTTDSDYARMIIGDTSAGYGWYFDHQKNDSAAVAYFNVGTGTGPQLVFQRAGTASVQIRSGTGSPESAVSAGVGSIFLRSDGGANTTLYVKESGSGNTGWVAK